MTAAGRDVVARLAEVMGELIGRPIGSDENFFEAGLDSASLVQVHREVTAAYPAAFPITELFARPNLRALGHFLTAGAVPDKPAGRHEQGQAVEARRRALGRRALRPHSEGDR
jgi:hypothetical protein